jgi:hypothetical protein
MADSTIQQLPQAGSLSGTDLTVVDQGGVTRSATLTKLTTLLVNLYNGAVNIWTKTQIGQVLALSVSANAIAIDMSQSNNFSVSLQATTSQVLSNPTNAIAGTSGQIAITQNATASTLTYGTSWISTDGSVPVVSVTPGAVNLLSFYVVDPTHVWFTLSRHGVV